MKLSSCLKGIRLPRPPAAADPQPLPAPEKVYLPLRQHQGAVAEPKVEPGDQVMMGQVVGASEDFESATVQATVSGTVEAIVQMPDPSGGMVPTVVIANDGADAWIDEPAATEAALASPEEVGATRPSRLLRRVREAGLVRAQVQGRPLHVDLSPPMAPQSYLYMTGIPVVRPIDTLIIKAVDPDPPVCPNASLLGEAGDELAVGVAALARISGASRIILALPSGADASALKAMAAQYEWETASVCQTSYPFAIDHLMVNSLTGREVPTPYGEPRDVGVSVQPLSTALDVGSVLLTGRPVVERVFSVTGEVKKPGVFRVRLGTPIGEVLDAAGGGPSQAGKVVVGGPMMGLAIYDLGTPVTRETQGVFVQSAPQVQHFADHPCIHCGRCVAVCPVNLIPSDLGKLCEFRMYEDAAEQDLMNCIECGCCAFVCPAQRPMVHFLRHGKTEVLAGRME
ncbi:MAG: RnfABCDGE type electron transport complex subunit C [Desulfarculaceae bacterium]|nr:RnfABCDGE type electron transport complex subunit C [Desulfarculaceae bacterium]MCF8073391.1 RnfABCDGE type electron transport complex subunit C [Desulfarculaceae bacterium]MCF8103499.1 RnfABCDGE type electron transport complex subunit C [Desulfarculaceae bacterium]MCF8115802.1 RnfABCDGE type electron transport complex subunit C [Desulfarculaceae bacterium]